MTTSQEIAQVQGEWWLPGAETEKVPGTFRFEVEAGGRLELLGGLHTHKDEVEWGSDEDGNPVRAVSDESIARAGTYPMIHGQVGGDAYTLLDCFSLTSRGFLFGALTTETVLVNRLIRGAWFGAAEEVAFERCEADLTFLTEWTDRTGLRRPLSTVRGRRDRHLC